MIYIRDEDHDKLRSIAIRLAAVDKWSTIDLHECCVYVEKEVNAILDHIHELMQPPTITFQPKPENENCEGI